MGIGIRVRVYPSDLNRDFRPAIGCMSHPIAGVEGTGLLQVGKFHLFTSAMLVDGSCQAVLGIGTLDKGDPLCLTALQLGICFRRAR